MPNTRNNPPVSETRLVDTLNTFKDNMERCLIVEWRK